jgi:hypothetical protein
LRSLDTIDLETLPPVRIHLVIAKDKCPMSAPADDDSPDKKGMPEERRDSEPAPDNLADSDKDNTSGKNRSPKKGQWLPGQSGNPSGRPKNKRVEATDSQAILDRLLTEPRSVVKNGRPEKLTTNEARLAVLVEQALRGNMVAHRILMESLSRRRSAAPKTATPDYREELRRRIEEMARRWEESQKSKTE